jgi:ABC-2 type transport system permease protein
MNSEAAVMQPHPQGMFVALIRREFWEHRSLWIAPLAVAALLLLATLTGALFAPGHVHIGGKLHIDTREATMMQMGIFGLAGQLLAIASLAITVYLLDCLYAERKDRSILFWKSLPVSDAHTVLAKVTVAMVIVPLGVFALALLVHPLIYGIAALGVPQFSAMTGGWNMGDWLRGEVALLAALLATMLWYAPLASWAMLASVVARRSPMLIAALPVVFVAVCENIVLRTANVWRFLGHRFIPILDPVDALRRPELWLGLAVAAGMLYMVIRLRRYRDDT